MREIEDIQEVRRRYLNGNRRVKDEILSSLETLYGYHRKSAIRLLNREVHRLCRGESACKGKRGRKPRYQDPGFQAVLRSLWRETDYMCSKNLKKAIPEWLPFFEQEEGELRTDIRERLLQVSASTIDRLLKPWKHQGKGRSGTRPGSLLRSEIPIRTDYWDVAVPGFMEGDTVAHCGGSLSGQFIWSLTATDICSTWTEVRSVWHKSHLAIIEQIMDIEALLPFPLLGWDSDNGGEFINHALVKHFIERSVAFTRSRPYRSNDNAHVEQKNYTHVRQLLGYSRLDNPALVPKLNEVFRNELSLLKNHFYPTRKLLSKTVIGGKTIRKHDSPQTPYERVLAAPCIPEKTKQRLRAVHKELNPIKLRKQLRSKLRRILRQPSVTPNYESSTLQT